MRLPIDTGTVKLANAGHEEIFDNERRQLNSVVHGPELFIRVEKAASILGIGRTQIFSLIMKGEISSVKIGRPMLVVSRDLEDFVRRLSAIQNPIG